MSALNAVGIVDFIATRGDSMCDGLLGECDNKDKETEMETENETGISRHGLATTGINYVSYAALSRNQVPCNRRCHFYHMCMRRKHANHTIVATASSPNAKGFEHRVQVKRDD